jgi:RND family efflux transporter MFP subunit
MVPIAGGPLAGAYVYGFGLPEMKLGSQIAATIAIAVALGAGWIWLAGPQEAAESSQGKVRSGGATRVLVEPVAFAQDRIVVRAVGTGDAQKSAAIHPSVSGEVTEVRFTAEQRVEKGAVLVRLDDEHQRLAVRLAEVALRKAKRDVARLKRLASSGHATRTGLDTAQTELESASVRHAQARADLDDRTIRAPFSGVIGLTEISVGDRVSDDTTIATLDDRSTILVDFNLAEDYAARIRLGDKIAVRPSTAPERRIEGTVVAMGSRIDPASRSLRVRAGIPNPDDTIRPGTSFTVELAFVGGAHPRVREVAVMWSRDGAYLWRARDGKAEKVFVRLVRRDRGYILIDGPLKEGELVVVEGVQGLRAGQRLEPRPFGADNAAVSPRARDRGGKGGERTRPGGGKP